MRPNRPFNPFLANQRPIVDPLRLARQIIAQAGPSETERQIIRTRQEELQARAAARLARVPQEEIARAPIISEVKQSTIDILVLQHIKNNDLDSLKEVVQYDLDRSFLYARDEFQNTPLLAAVKQGNKDIIEFILSLCERQCLEDVDGLGRTPLLASLIRGNFGITQNLINKGSDVRARDISGKSALHLIAQGGHYNLLRLFPELDVNQTDNARNTPLMLTNDRHTAQELLLRGANPSAVNRDGNTALHLRIELLPLLLSYGGDPNLQDSMGNTPLHIVRSLEDIQSVLEAGADPNIQNMDGDTSLHVHWTREQQRVLLGAGADPNIPNNEGRVPQLL
jgi:ankyrin repeat protein